MNRNFIRSICGVAVLCISVLAHAQELPLPHLGGHSLVGEVFNEGPRQAAQLIPGSGPADFPLSSKNAEAKKFFNQGMGQLYGFWNYEAERSFRQAAKLDPASPMPYWGMAMANTVFQAGSPQRAVGFVAEMLKRKHKASPFEALWVDGLAAVYAGGAKPKRAAREAWADSFARVDLFQKSVDAQAFGVLVRWENQMLFGSKLDAAVADGILETIFKAHPLHPAHHFRIHLWNGRDPARAKDSLALCGPSASGIAHMWHMPGHIYAERRLIPDAAWHQEASARVDHQYMLSTGVMPYEIHNYAHNNEWAIRSLTTAGAATKALELAKNFSEIPGHPKKNASDDYGSVLSYAPGRLRWVLQTFGLWDEARRLEKTTYWGPSETPIPFSELSFLARYYFGTADAKRLGELKGQVEKQNASPEKSRLLKDLEAYGLWLENKTKEAVAIFRDQLAVRDYDFLVPQLLERGEGALALEITKAQLKPFTPKIFFVYKILALHAAGKKPEAKGVFEMLRENSALVDLSIPLFQSLDSIAKEYGLPTDWRLERADLTAAEKMSRGKLDSLGPLRWHPQQAPGLKLDSTRGEQNLASFIKDGKPVLLIFYLGSRCLKCVAQLKAVIPEVEKFEKAGITVLPVGTDSVEKLAEWESHYRTETGTVFPFPMLSDPEAKMFKRFRTYDDFEEFPLHGVHLIDGKGKIRWQEISADPFTDFKFLLAESKRLLSL